MRLQARLIPMTALLTALLLAVACRESTNPDRQLQAGMEPSTSESGRSIGPLREGSVIRRKVRFEVSVGAPGNQRRLTGERVMQGTIKNGVAIGRIIPGSKAPQGLRLSVDEDPNAECPECQPELDSLFHSFGISLARVSIQDASYSFSGVDSLGRTHHFASIADAAMPAHQVESFIGAEALMKTNMDWSAHGDGWLLTRQNFEGYSEGTVAMSWTATMNEEFAVQAPRLGEAMLANAVSAFCWLLPRTAGAQTPACENERNHLIAASVAFAMVLGKVVKQRGIPTWGDYKAGVAASTAFGATLAEYRSCRSGGTGDGRNKDEIQ